MTEPAEPGDWRVFGGGTPATTRVITPEGELLQGVVEVEWRQEANALPELLIRVHGAPAGVSTSEPPLITCDRCDHEHRCETENEKMMRSLSTTAGAHAITVRPSPTTYISSSP